MFIAAVAAVALMFDSRLPPEVARLAAAEAAAIWRPYGVDVVMRQRPSEEEPCSGAQTLTVRIADAPPPTTRGGAFAAIRFVGTEPEPVVLLYLEAVKRRALAGALVGGVRESDWPETLRTRMLGRVVGRALAHELGHWLLRSKTHSQSGLMRAVYTTADLMATSRGRFALAREDVARLPAGLAPLRQARINADGGGAQAP